MTIPVLLRGDFIGVIQRSDKLVFIEFPVIANQ